MNQELVPLEDLLSKTASGDRIAFKTLYERSSAKLFGVILRILKNREKSEDVLQDVFLKIWQKAGSYDPAYGRPITWMATIARNRAIDIIRATRPETTVDEPGDEEEIFRLGGQDAQQVGFEDLETLRICLGEMKSDVRQYVLLAYYEGYSREELAERFDAPIGTIKTRLRRGLLALRTCLEKA
ncbi:sigma-70 family RNA polymerase sigma factor [Pseudahrensia aquimaris]|uniref:Sigma-70 family RNA polymerase sigma factor n=1 Tax=Pseudahrensia aquimaris TaxID=744461 RepID=A0ABW3FH55_9HYPH